MMYHTCLGAFFSVNYPVLSSHLASCLEKNKFRSFVKIDKYASSFGLTGHVMYDLYFCFHLIACLPSSTLL